MPHKSPSSPLSSQPAGSCGACPGVSPGLVLALRNAASSAKLPSGLRPARASSDIWGLAVSGLGFFRGPGAEAGVAASGDCAASGVILLPSLRPRGESISLRVFPRGGSADLGLSGGVRPPAPSGRRLSSGRLGRRSSPWPRSGPGPRPPSRRGPRSPRGGPSPLGGRGGRACCGSAGCRSPRGRSEPGAIIVRDTRDRSRSTERTHTLTRSPTAMYSNGFRTNRLANWLM